MPLMTLRQLLDDAAERDYAVPAFNISNMEQALAVMQAAQAREAPVILQASLNTRTVYTGDIMLLAMVEALARMFPATPICLHQDHGYNEAACITAIKSGFTSVMMDGSLKTDGKTPSSYAENIAITGRVVHTAHLVGASVEGELGVLGSLETGTAEEEDGVGASGRLDRSQLCTDPDQAADFVAQTGVDALAIACGTSHGPFKFSRKPDGDILAIDVIERIHARLPNTHLVMHGSSSVPEYLQRLINDHGGQMPVAFGVPVDEIVRAIRFGVRKVNIDTDCRMAMSGQLRKYAIDHPAELDPRKFFLAAMQEMRRLCRDRYEQFGAAGKAGGIKVVPMETMAGRYAGITQS